MPTTTETTIYNTAATLTIKNYARKFTGQYLTRRPAVGLFFDDYRQTDSAGGRTWQGMVDYGQNTSSPQFFTGTDTFNTQPNEFAQPIQYDWKYLGGGISMSQVEMLENSGPVALASLMDGRIKQLNRTFDIIIGNEIFSDGTNFGGKSFVGLARAIDTTPTSTLGGLSGATWDFWQNNAATTFGSFAANGPNGTTDSWITVWNNCTDGDIMPDFTISSQGPWESYHKTCNAEIRFTRPGGQGGTGDVTWRSLEYMGKPWYWDRQCPTGRAYFIRKEDSHFVVDPRYLWKWTDPLTYPDQLAFSKIVGIRFCMRHKRRMFQAVIDGITA